MIAIRTCALAVAAACALGSAPALHAQEANATFGLNFKQIDADGDGRITGAEIESFWESGVRAQFGSADTDRDGNLSEFEFDAWTKNGPVGAAANRAVGEGFDLLDRNRDMVLTPEEANALPALRNDFARLDRNRDNQLQRDELTGAMAQGQGNATFGLNFKRVDANNDGMVTGAEFGSAWQPGISQALATADTDRDGALSEFEFNEWVGNGPVGPRTSRVISESFDMLDRNDDRVLTPDEAGTLEVLQKEFAYADRNHNGRLAEWEFDEWLELTGRTAAR